MNGILTTSGQNWILDAINTKITSNGGLYIGLMSNQLTINREDQTPIQITELSDTTCSGYSRTLCSDWTHVSGTNPYLIGSGVTFTIASGNWANVYGYFISYSSSNSGVLWAEQFPSDKCGVIASGNPIIINPIYRQY